ncbi:glycosyltransferase family 4 protein [Enterococcus sp.]|uniref:glycosyltransferase family 4 protein n=1 Tax=Enterococcus sp. TaxID=35783 RepID=UPI003C74E6F5
MNIAFITYALAPYRTRQFDEIVKAIPNLKMSVYYYGQTINTRKWIVNRSDFFKEHLLKGYFKWGNQYLIYKDIKKIVQNNDIIMLGGYSSPLMFLLTYYIGKYNKNAVLIMDGISPKKLNERRNLKYLIKKLLINRMNAYFANGEVSKRYLNRNFNVDPSKIFNQYLTVDVDKIHEISMNTRNINIKKETKFTILYSGRLLSGKRVEDILYAIESSPIRDRLKLLIVGSGEEKNKIQQLGEELNFEISYLDFIERQDELFQMYGTVDCLILPSENDAWGLVVNEAEAAELPVIVSDACGCVFDLVKEGKNGYSYKSGDIKELSHRITQVYNSKLKGEKMGEESFKIISNWKFSDSVQSFQRLLRNLKK